MVGITSYGVHVPRYRMDRKLIFEQTGWFNMANAAYARGEKAVLNYDEDTITMAASAVSECLKGKGKGKGSLDGLFLASLSLPFAERQNSVIVSKALDCSSGIRTSDFTGSLRSGTAALLSALDAVKDGGSVVSCASDCRMGKPGSSQEYTFADGAVAFMTGTENVIAEFKGSYSVAEDFIDSRRLPEERFSHTWEERWIRDEGYAKIIPAAVKGLFKKYNFGSKDFAKIVIGCPVAGVLKNLAKAIGAEPEQLQDNMIANVGDTGVALPLMMFAAALEEAKPGDKILVVSYGYGSDALCFEVTDEIEKNRKGRKGVKEQIDSKANLAPYVKYLIFRNIIPLEVGIRGEEISPTLMSVLWRQGREISGLVGTKCTACGTPQYPPQTICVNPKCGAIGQMEDYCFSDKVGTLNSYTGDNLAFTWDPPQLYGMVDFEGGGRIMLDLTDCTLDSLSVGMPVSLVFRKKYSDTRRGVYNYFWKAVPVKK